MNKELKRTIIGLVSLGACLTTNQSKAEENFSYESTGALGEIQDMVLSDNISDNKFALKTKGAKIGSIEYPVWIGNTDNLGAAFTSPWMTNAVASCAFHKGDLYLAPKGTTNYLYRIKCSKDQNPIPNTKIGERVNFPNLKSMTEPYLYATTNHLYAIDNNDSEGVTVHTFNTDSDTNTLTGTNSCVVSGIQKGEIKDIVFKTANDRKDCLYILSINKNKKARLDLVLVKENKIEAENKPLSDNFDHTTTITVHGSQLLVANNTDENAFRYTIDSQGSLSDKSEFQPDLNGCVTAIGSNQNYYYAESREGDGRKLFVRGKNPADLCEEPSYENSKNRSGTPVHKFISRNSGEIFAISKNQIFRIRD